MNDQKPDEPGKPEKKKCTCGEIWLGVHSCNCGSRERNIILRECNAYHTHQMKKQAERIRAALSKELIDKAISENIIQMNIQPIRYAIDRPGMVDAILKLVEEI